jgi:hypothetical protein
MASFKKAENCNKVNRGQLWKNHQNGRIGKIVHRGQRGKEWIMLIGKKSHHVNEGTILKYFILISL